MKKVLVVSDLQTGSKYSNWPTELPIKDGGHWRLNPKQRIVKAAWDSFVRLANEKIRPDVIVLNGDMIEGCQYKSQAAPVVTPEASEQCEAAKILLGPLLDSCKEAYLVRGTEYHDGLNGQDIERLGKDLDCIPYRKNQYSDWVLNLDIEGVVINFAHHISVSTGIYRATAPDREGIWGALSGKAKTPDADCIVRSHVHTFVHVEHSKKHIIITPGWQLQTEYQIKKSYYRMFPEIGSVLLHLYPELKEKGEDPIEVKKIICKIPREACVISNV